MSKKISTSVLKKIEQDQITPRPRWHFWLRNGLFWFIFALSVLLGSRAVAVVLYTFTAVDWEFLARARGPFFMPIVRLIPPFWMTLFVLFILLAVLGLHHTKKGYKLSVKKLITLNLGISLVLGLGLFALHDGPRFEDQLRRFAPKGFSSVEQRRGMVWSQPHEGRLAGDVIALEEDQVMVLDDLSQKRWQVDISEAESWDNVYLAVGARVRVVGEQTGEETFTAEVLGAWGRDGKRNRRDKPPRRGREIFERNEPSAAY